MANIKAAIKDIRKTEKRTTYNKRIKNRYRTAIKEFNQLVDKGDLKEGQVLLPRINKLIDKAAKKNILNKQTASRKISRMTKKLNNLTAQNVETAKGNT